MINWTSLSNRVMMTKIVRAQQEAKRTGLPVYITNKKGLPIMRVAYQQGRLTFYSGNRNMHQVVRMAFNFFKQMIKGE